MDLRFFKIKNPWRDGLEVVESAIRRHELDLLADWDASDEILVVYGPRRVGKSTLLVSIVRELLLAHAVRPGQIYFFDMDTMDCADVLASAGTLIDFIGMPSQRTYVLIDEVQRLPNPGLFLKGVRDLGLPIKLIVSGSSTLELRSKIRETLSGRKRIIRLGALNWAEYRSAFPAGGASWQDYLVHGGYPAVALEPRGSEKRRLLLEYFESYLDRDIDSFLRVDRMDIFRSFLRLLGFQVGSLVNLNELSATLGVARDTLARYLFYLEETFLVRRLSPFARNPRKEIAKMPKVFFVDSGWRNLLSAGFADWDARTDTGPLLENAVENWLRLRYPLAHLHFWRTEAKAEVDFVLDTGERLEAYEVKARALKEPRISRGLRSFLTTYAPARVTVVNLGLNETVTCENVPVHFRTYPDCMNGQTRDGPDREEPLNARL